jgi:hypothetical protein
VQVGEVEPRGRAKKCREGRQYSRRRSCGGSVVLVDEAAKQVAAVDLARCWTRSLGSWTWRLEIERQVRPLAVVVVDVDAKDVFKMAAVENQQPVQTLRPDGPDEAFRDCVRLR